MSLVSYADSDDSGEEDITAPQVQRYEDKNEDKDLKLAATQSPTPTKPAQDATKAPSSDTDNDGNVASKPKSIGSFFSSLPAPWMSTVSWTNKNSDKKPGRKQKGLEKTVKISLPRPSVVDDSDSDDEGSVRKNVTASDSQKPSGLFSLLPKPKRSVVVKENNPNRPVTKISNRPLIPDSLRRKQSKKPTKPTPKSKKDDSDDDSDDGEGGSFFSWNEKVSSTAEDVSTSQTVSDAEKKSGSVASPRNIMVIQTGKDEGNLSLTKSTVPSRTKKTLVPSFAGHTQGTSNTESVQTLPQAAPDENKPSENFEDKNYYSDNNTQEYPYQTTTDYSLAYPTDNATHAEQNYPYSDYYNSEQYTLEAETYEQNNPDWQSTSQTTVQDSSEQLKKFLGKRGRGEEHINIIDVNADDQVSSSQEWKSQYQKEDADYKPQSKKKGNLPSSQQRRKHQITYLAFQAKEKEWELRNQWSANRQTRRQTQSKYGF